MDQLIEDNSKSGNEKGAYYYAPTRTYFDVPEDETEYFWLMYCDMVDKSVNPQIMEVIKHDGSVQLNFDIHICFNRNSSPNADMEDMIIASVDLYVMELIRKIQYMITTHYDISATIHRVAACYLCRRENNLLEWNNKTVDFYGKIIFPYARVNINEVMPMYEALMEHLHVHKKEMDSLLYTKPLNELHEIVSPPNLEFNELYGSGKTDEHVLELEVTYGNLNLPVISKIQLDNLLVLKAHPAFSSGRVTEEDIAHIELKYNGVNHWKPLLFSLDYFNKCMTLKVPFTENEIPRAPQRNADDVGVVGEALSELDRAEMLLALLDDKKADEYWSWLDVGKAIFSISEGDDGFKLWKSFTGRGKTRNDEDVEKEWGKFSNDGKVTIGTLEYFASIDSPIAYDEINRAKIMDLLVKAVDKPENTPVAKAFHACFPFDFVLSSYDKDDWHMYSNHRYKKCDRGDIMFYINEKFVPKLDALQKEASSKIANAPNNEIRMRNQNLLTSIGGLVSKLNDHSYKNKIVSELKIYYKKENFIRWKDSETHLFGCNNGVIDVRDVKAIFRDGKPEDYITKTSRPFPKYYTHEHPDVKEVHTYMSQVIRNTAKLACLWRFLGSRFISGNLDKIFLIWEGELGNNSKSMLVRLIEKAMGSYCSKLQSYYLTEEKKNSNAATPADIHTDGVKLLFFQEPDEHTPIRASTLKEITGQDTMTRRELFEKGSEMTDAVVTYVPVIVANKVCFPHVEQPIWTRTRRFLFDSVWKYDAPETLEEQYNQGIFKLDPNFPNKLEGMAPAFLWIMFHKYEEYRREGLNEPPEILKDTEAFRLQNNYYLHYLRENIKRALIQSDKLTDDGQFVMIDDQSAYVELDELYVSFKEWYKFNNNTGTSSYKLTYPTKSDFKKNLGATMGVDATHENGKYVWKGLEFIVPRNSTAANGSKFS